PSGQDGLTTHFHGKASASGRPAAGMTTKALSYLAALLSELHRFSDCDYDNDGMRRFGLLLTANAA
ncbi:MAG: hypothetical protein JZU52_17040, partial [Lamprocystis purpurea]|nr:hypothetical protein [Lamprocystis purpurea]